MDDLGGGDGEEFGAVEVVVGEEEELLGGVCEGDFPVGCACLVVGEDTAVLGADDDVGTAVVE